MEPTTPTRPTYGPWSNPWVSWDEYGTYPNEKYLDIRRVDVLPNRYWCVRCQVGWRQAHQTKGRCWKCGRFSSTHATPPNGPIMR